ncbi:tripartite tricarboxylate transporter permease [Roseitranquillus sediminis]|uniref:tripartite tricarboxylate transporter permease n=1 Tax=Roseitranquillus sediminis TaxID=2809051 RepID=UPI001D0C82E1|nr:tripartite tricarboxylate transporter permease [Roseitranquillus sediminis]MBM9593857.1 tripartite tricarboxylate transporter permease [Roseitranquillus sediminis]
MNTDALYEALSLVFTFKTIMWLVIGVALGVGLGAIPGLTASTGIALVLPLSFMLDITGSLGLLIGLYKGAVFGGSISAISFATPGSPDSAATVFDGYRMTKEGKGRKAILMALYSSVTGDAASDIVVILVAPTIALLALQFGPTERLWLMVLAIALLGALSGRHLAKGLFSAAIGLFLGTIGADPVSSVARNTFGQDWLRDGIHLVPLVIGVFAMSQMLEQGLELLRRTRAVREATMKLGDLFGRNTEGLTFREYLSAWREMGIGIGVGTFVGILPGLGATVAAFLSFGIAKQLFPKKRIGEGSIYGIAAAEAGNNATVGPTLVPLLAFGIPGSATAALIGAALMLQGITPSPRMFQMYPEVIYALFIILILGNFFNLAIGRMFAFFYARLGQLPGEILVPTIMVMSVIGAYAARSDPYDVLMMLGLAFMGFGMRKVGMPEAPLIITFLIAPLLEQNLRRALLITRGEWSDALFGSPVAIGLAGAAALLLVVTMRANIGGRLSRVGRQQDEPTGG